MGLQTRPGAPPTREPLPGGFLVQCGPLFIIGAVVLFLRSRWSDIPRRFAIHWSASGQPNGWAFRTPMGVFLPLAIGAGIWLLFQVMERVIAGAPVRSAASGFAARDARVRTTLLGTMTAVCYAVACLFAEVALLPLRARPERSPPLLALIGPMLLVIVVSTVMLIRASRGGPRRPDTALQNDDHWRAGVFYVNPADPSFLVPKRFGIGYTFNFAHPLSWISMGALLLLVAAALLLPKILA